MPEQNSRTKKKQPKPKRLANNKTLFKFLMPKSSYLENIRIGEIDIPLLILILVLLVFGLIMMYSASYAWAIHDGKAQDYYFKRQLVMSAIGLTAMIFVASPLFDYHIFKHPLITFGFFGLCIVFLLIVHIPGIGITDGGASRWISVGSPSNPIFSFQPSEMMKLAIILLFAHMISSNHQNIKTIKYGVIPYMAILVLVAGLVILQPHISGTIIICVIAISMMFVGGMKLSHFITLCITGTAGLTAVGYFLYKMGYDYIYNRIQGWLYTFDDANRDIAWQTRNSLIAIGSGGLFGLGLGNSRQKFLYLPESQNDFVFSIVCEELGFFGAAVVIVLFLMLIFRGFEIAQNAPDKYGMLLASGITVQIGVQALLNIAVVSNAIPNTGISLPFFSYGGTALIMQLAQMGIILNISRQSIPRKEKPDADQSKELEKISRAKKQLGTSPGRENTAKPERKN